MKSKCKYKWIRIRDIRGEEYEFEDSEFKTTPLTYIIFFKAPLGIVEACFTRSNVISIEVLEEGKE